MHSEDETCEFDVIIIRETLKALLCLVDGDEEVWIPKSVVDYDASTATEQDDNGTICIKSWWAFNKGLI